MTVKFSVRLATAFAGCLLSPLINAQSTPAEFAELSLQELFELSAAEENLQNNSRWSWAYQYKYAQFDGYLDGDSSLTFDQVLWDGPGLENRTSANFPVVPTVITQEAHVFNLSYQVNPDFRLDVAVPFIEQKSDHISSVPGYDNFVIATEGWGDVVLTARHQLATSNKHLWWASVGLSLPTGTIDEQGDTPRAPGDQQLPYTMQKGSGTYDLPLEFSYQSLGHHDYTFTVSAMLRTGTNDRNYRLGNRYRVAGRYRFPISATMQGFLSGEAQYTQSIQGMDEDLLVDAPIPYPASITNPRLYGGKKVSLGAGVHWQISNNYRLTVDLSKPVYQYLNGPQPRESVRGGIQLVMSL